MGEWEKGRMGEGEKGRMGEGEILLRPEYSGLRRTKNGSGRRAQGSGFASHSWTKDSGGLAQALQAIAGRRTAAAWLRVCRRAGTRNNTMKNQTLFLLLLLILTSSSLCFAQDKKKVNSRYYTVTRVIDGDTFWIDDGSEKGLKIRLIGEGFTS